MRQPSRPRSDLISTRTSNEVLPTLIKLDVSLPVSDGYAIAILLGAVPTVPQLSLAIGCAAEAEVAMIHPSLFEMVSKSTELKSMDLQLMSRFSAPPLSSDYKSC